MGSLQNGLPFDAVFFMVEVAGNIGESGGFHIGQGLFHAIVELVVAQSGNVVACGIHQRQDGIPLVHGAVSGALNMVAGVCQQNIAFAVGFFQFIPDAGDDIIAQWFVDVGMYIVGVEDDHILLGSICCSGSRSRGLGGGRGILSGCLCAAAEQAQTQGHCQYQCEELTHN